MDKLTAMRTFVAVVDAGSFSNAALRLSIPKTRVSQRVQELEAALSTRLLYRTTRVVSLTEEGRTYFDKCARILADIDDIEQTLSMVGEKPTGRLRVSTMSLVSRYFLLPRIADFQSAFPQISLNLSVSDRLANLNEAGLDCAIRGGALESSSLISRHIRDVSFSLYAASHWNAGRSIAAPEDLSGADLIKTLR
ncbi:MAG: LysR family transcriptional regulator, partial [Hyphomicrobiales bacterium]